MRKEQGIQYTPTNLADLLAIKLKYYSDNYFPEDKKITILDPACGDGSLLKSVDKYFSNYKSIGIDLDITAIDKAKHPYGRKGSYVQQQLRIGSLGDGL